MLFSLWFSIMWHIQIEISPILLNTALLIRHLGCYCYEQGYDLKKLNIFYTRGQLTLTIQESEWMIQKNRKWTK